MVKVSTSMRIEDKMLKALKRLAFENETTQTELINKYIKSGLKKDGINVDELLSEE